jgi:hypothetical protein
MIAPRGLTFDGGDLDNLFTLTNRNPCSTRGLLLSRFEIDENSLTARPIPKVIGACRR